MGGMSGTLEAKTKTALREKAKVWEETAEAKGLDVINGYDHERVEKTENGYRIRVHAHS